MSISVIIIRVRCMDMSSVVTYIGLVCDPVGGVGCLPAPVLDETYISDHGGHIHTSTLMMMTEMDIETSVYYVHLTRLIAREDFIKHTHTYLLFYCTPHWST
jgi:membrane-associated protease RseP (regulator of RpoE activity)